MFSFRKGTKPSDSVRPETHMHPRVAVLISAGKIKTIIWQLVDHKIEILGRGEKSYSSEGKEQDLVYKELLNASADAIDMACNVAEVDVQQAIFGIPQTWLSEEQLLPEYEEYIEKLNKDLSLEGVAYVSVPHAISYFLQYLHKVPPTILLVGMTREGATISYVEAGKVMESHRVTWSGSSAVQSLYRGIILFKSQIAEINKLYLYGFGNLDIAKKELESFDWQAKSEDQSKPAFLQKPQIIVLEDQVESYAVSLVGAKDYAKQQNVKGRLQIDLPFVRAEDISTPPASLPENPVPLTSDTNLPATDLIATAAPEINSAIAPASFGFVKNVDIAAAQVPTKPNFSHDEIPPVQKEPLPDTDETEEYGHDHLEDTQFSQVRIQDWHDQKALEDEHAGIEVLESAPKSRKMPHIALPRRKLIFGVLFLLVLVFGLGAAAVYAYWTLPTAEVTVYVKTQTIPKEITITASEKSSISVTDKTIPAAKITVEVTDKTSTPTTGTKTIGESAKGTVTIYNKTTNEQSLKKGTILKTNNLEFELSADISVASASASIEGQTNGKTEGQATARQIGTASNIKDQATLSIGTFARSDLEAVAKGDFSGGTEKEVKVVTVRDIAKLRDELTSSIESKVIDAVKAQTSSSDIVLEKAWTKSDPKITYTKKANDEASTVDAEALVTVTAYTVKQSDVQELLSSVADQNVPEGYELQSKDNSSKTEFVSFANGIITLKAASNIEVTPQLDTNSIIDKIVGKKEPAAREIILSDTRIFDVGFTYSFNLPESLSSLPRVKDNITVKRDIRDLNI